MASQLAKRLGLTELASPIAGEQNQINLQYGDETLSYALPKPVLNTEYGVLAYQNKHAVIFLLTKEDNDAGCNDGIVSYSFPVVVPRDVISKLDSSALKQRLDSAWRSWSIDSGDVKAMRPVELGK